MVIANETHTRIPREEECLPGSPLALDITPLPLHLKDSLRECTLQHKSMADIIPEVYSLGPGQPLERTELLLLRSWLIAFTHVSPKMKSLTSINSNLHPRLAYLRHH